MRDVLQRILKPEELPRRFCTVQSVLEDGRYIVVDDWARKLTVDGAAGYLPGSQVIVQSNRIVGYGSRSAATKKFRV